MTFTIDYRVYLIAFVVVVICVSVYLSRERLNLFLKKNYPLWVFVVFVRRHLNFLVLSVLIAIFFVFISALTIAFLIRNDTETHFWRFIVASPGTIFVLLMAIFTVLGLLITITRIHEITSRITRYDELLIRAAKLLRDEIKESHNGPRVVRMVCTTPLHGNLTEGPTGYYKEYKGAIHLAQQKLVLHVLHQPIQELEVFYDGFWKAGRFAEHDAKNALDETVRFLKDLNDTSDLRQRAKEIGHQNTLPVHSTSHLWSEIGYRLLLSDKRAIFYVPLFLPFESTSQDTYDQLESPHFQKTARVEMIGFESEDPFVVGQLTQNFNYLEQRSTRTGAEYQEYIQADKYKIRLSAMRPISDSRWIQRKESILLVHGLTGYIGDRMWKERLHFRDKLSSAGFASYEFDYRGRGRDSNPLDFSLNTAVEDLNAVIKYLFDHEKLNKVFIIARGLAAFISLRSPEAKLQNCPLVFWQPILHPDRTMESRGHTKAFNEAYLNSEGHNYVEIDGVRIGKAYFDSLHGLQLPEDMSWDNIEICIFYNEGDQVTRKEWIDEFISAIKGDSTKKALIKHEIVGSGTHLTDSSMPAYVDKTLQFLVERSASGSSVTGEILSDSSLPNCRPLLR